MSKDIETIKRVIDVGRDHIVDRFEWAIFIFTYIGWFILCISIFMILFLIWERFYSVPVAVKIIEIKEEINKNTNRSKDNSDPETYILYRPKFEIISGKYIGKAGLSASASSMSDHKVGDVMNGYYSEKSGQIESIKTRMMGLIMLSIFVLMGVFLSFILPTLIQSSIIFE